MANNGTVVLSTPSSEYFALKVAQQLDLPMQNVIRKTFKGGEKYRRVEVDHRRELSGKNAIFVASTHTDENFLELLMLGSKLHQMGIEKKDYMIPFSGYSTMEREKIAGEVVMAKEYCRLLSLLPGSHQNWFWMFDLHKEDMIGFFEGDCRRRELYGEKYMIRAIESLQLDDFIIGSADMGRPKWIKTFAKHFGVEIALVDKDRDFEKINHTGIFGSVYGRWVVIYDDMIRSADTLMGAIDMYLAAGAKGIYVVTSHLAFNSPEIITLCENSPIIRLIGTNTHPMSQHPLVAKSKKIEVIDVTEKFSSELIH